MSNITTFEAIEGRDTSNRTGYVCLTCNEYHRTELESRYHCVEVHGFSEDYLNDR